MNTIETLSGDVNLRTASAKAHFFHCPRVGSYGVEERHLGIAAKSPQTSSVVTTITPYPQVIPSVQGYSTEVGGKMVRMTYAVADGEFIKVFVQRRPGAGKLSVTACQLLHVRATAAMRALEIKLLTDPKVHEPFALIRGRFDLVTFDEAKALGARLSENYRKLFSPALVDHVITATVLDPEKAQATVVQLANGQSVVQTTVKRRRAIKL